MKKDLIVKNLVDFVNKSIPEEYIDLLANCGCNVSLIGYSGYLTVVWVTEIRLTAAMFAIKIL